MIGRMTLARLDARDIVARATTGLSANHGRLPVGAIRTWSNFPYDGDLTMVALDEPVLPEPERGGLTPEDCPVCPADDSGYLWCGERWRLRSITRGGSLPVFLLEPREHLDFGDLSEDLAAEMGVLAVRVERALASIDGVGRVHVDRWGDGLVHLHLWFYARPAGMLQLKGLFMPSWADTLPALPDEVADAIDARMAELLA